MRLLQSIKAGEEARAAGRLEDPVIERLRSNAEVPASVFLCRGHAHSHHTVLTSSALT